MSLGIRSRRLERSIKQSGNYLITPRPPESRGLPEHSAMERKILEGAGGEKTGGTPSELIRLNGTGDHLHFNSRRENERKGEDVFNPSGNLQN